MTEQNESIAIIVARIDERTQHMKETMDTHVADTKKILDEHTRQISINTNFRNRAIGWIAGAGGLGAIIGKFLPWGTS